VKIAAESLPSDLAAAHAMIVAERAARLVAETKLAEAANAQAQLSSTEALIAYLKLEIEKLKRALYGSSSERSARLLDQLELQLEELEAAATEDELVAEQAAEKTQTVRAFERKRPVRQPYPDNIERERVVLPAPTQCPCCGSARLSKLGESVTSTLEEIPRRFKVIDTLREKFTCRDCEAITQPPAPFHATPRGYIGPQLLATILFDKFGQHLPLNRQSQRFKCEGIELSVSTLADQVGAGVVAAMPLFRLIECACRREAPWRRYGDPASGEGEDGHGADLDLCPRRPAVWRPGSSGGAVLRLPRSARRASGATSSALHRHSAS
jgi:transposase